MQTSSANGVGSSQEQDLRAQLELLKNHESNSGRDPKNAPVHLIPSRPPNGYETLAAITPDIARALASKPRSETHIHPELRARTTMMPMAPPSGHSPGASAGPSATSIAPATHAPPPSQVPGLPELPPADGRKAKRELSQSKRAAQNRAAQRAFRQRKEGYIKKLEQQVRDYLEMEQSFKAMQSENYALREYVIHLQSRLLDLHGEFPSPPPNVNLSQPPPAPASASVPGSASASGTAATASAAAGAGPSTVAVGPLEAVAQAVAGLAAQEQIVEQQQQQQSPPPQPPQSAPRYPSPQFKATEPVDEEMRSAEELDRHLQQPEEPPTQASAV